jgi:hypothetical protein
MQDFLQKLVRWLKMCSEATGMLAVALEALLTLFGRGPGFGFASA